MQSPFLKSKKPVSFILDEALKLIWLNLSAWVFLIFCDAIGSMYKALSRLHTEIDTCLEETVFVGLSELWAELASLSMEHNFDLKEQLTDKLWLFRLGYLVDIFTKKNLKEKKASIFCQ